ncbi:MAG: epimerase, partial [Ekhidna sp.]
PVDITMGYANVIWQGDANAIILRSLLMCESPAKILNITGLETISVKDVATKFGQLMNKEVVVTGEEDQVALLSNSSLITKEMGSPEVTLDEVMQWTADWVNTEKSVHGKPTHFEVKDGKY